MKLHLTAKVPNEGARRLAQWVLGLPRGLDDAAVALDTGADRVQRIIGGDMVPGFDVGTRLTRFTGVRHRDFSRPAQAGWFERPAPAVAA